MKRLLGWGFPRALLSCPTWALPPGKRRPLGRGRVRGGLAAPARAGARGCATCYLLGLGLLHLHQEKGLHEATADGALQPLDVARVGVIEHLPLPHRRLRLADVSPGDTVGSRVPMENAAEGVRTERTESVLSGQAREVVSRRRLCLEVLPRPRASGALCFPPSRALWLQQHLQVLWSHLPLLLNTHLQPLVEVGRVRVRAPRGRPQHVPRAAPRCCGDGHGRVLRQRAWPPARHHPAGELARRVRVAGPCPGAGSAAPGDCDRTGTGRGEAGALYYHRRQYQPHPLGLDTP